MDGINRYLNSKLYRGTQIKTKNANLKTSYLEMRRMRDANFAAQHP
jgi:hypothetical protein